MSTKAKGKKGKKGKKKVDKNLTGDAAEAAKKELGKLATARRRAAAGRDLGFLGKISKSGGGGLVALRQDGRLVTEVSRSVLSVVSSLLTLTIISFSLTGRLAGLSSTSGNIFSSSSNSPTSSWRMTRLS